MAVQIPAPCARPRPILPALPAALVLLSLAMGCSVPGISKPDATSSGQWKANYLSARNALEAGRAAEAAAAYARIVDASGPVEPRVRLEYAHALLRAQEFASAAEQASRAAAQQDGAGRSAARAVQAVADHEQVRMQMRSGQADTELTTRLTAAGTMLDAVLAGDSDVDPEGGLAARRAEIAGEVTRLRVQLGI